MCAGRDDMRAGCQRLLQQVQGVGIHVRWRRVGLEVACGEDTTCAEVSEASRQQFVLRQHDTEAIEDCPRRRWRAAPATERPRRDAGVDQCQRHIAVRGLEQQVGPDLGLGENADVWFPVVQKAADEVRHVERNVLVDILRAETSRSDLGRRDRARGQQETDIRAPFSQCREQRQYRVGLADAGGMHPGEASIRARDIRLAEAFVAAGGVLLAALCARSEHEWCGRSGEACEGAIGAQGDARFCRWCVWIPAWRRRALWIGARQFIGSRRDAVQFILDSKARALLLVLVSIAGDEDRAAGHNRQPVERQVQRHPTPGVEGLIAPGCHGDGHYGSARHARQRHDARPGDARGPGWNVGCHGDAVAASQRADGLAQRLRAATIPLTSTSTRAADHRHIEIVQNLPDQLGVAVPCDHATHARATAIDGWQHHELAVPHGQDERMIRLREGAGIGRLADNTGSLVDEFDVTRDKAPGKPVQAGFVEGESSHRLACL